MIQMELRAGAWCLKYGHWIERATIDDMCKKKVPKGCFYCEHIAENVVINGVQVQGYPKPINDI